jgi:Fe2+ or Zn2+ uptake regulation protein
VSHFNTTHETGPTLRAYTQQANRQEAAVLALFRRHPDCLLSPSTVCALLNKMLERQWLLTSIRRAITSLTDQGLLEKTSKKVIGPHGRAEFQWRLV